MAARVQRCNDFLRTFRQPFHTEKVAREREGIEAKAQAQGLTSDLKITFAPEIDLFQLLVTPSIKEIKGPDVVNQEALSLVYTMS